MAVLVFAAALHMAHIQHRMKKQVRARTCAVECLKIQSRQFWDGGQVARARCLACEFASANRLRAVIKAQCNAQGLCQWPSHSRGA